MKRALCAMAIAILFVSVATVSRAVGAGMNRGGSSGLAETGKDRSAFTVELFTGGASSRTDIGADADVDWRDFSGLAFTFAKGVPWWWSEAAPSVSLGWSTFGVTGGIEESGGNGDVADPAHRRIRRIGGEFLEAGLEIPLFSSEVFRKRGDRWGHPWRPYFLVAYMDGDVGITTQKGPDVPYSKADPADISERIVHAHGMKYGFALSFGETSSLVLSVRLIRAPLGIVRDISLTSIGFQANWY